VIYRHHNPKQPLQKALFSKMVINSPTQAHCSSNLTPKIVTKDTKNQK